MTEGWAMLQIVFRTQKFWGKGGLVVTGCVRMNVRVCMCVICRTNAGPKRISSPTFHVSHDLHVWSLKRDSLQRLMRSSTHKPGNERKVTFWKMRNYSMYLCMFTFLYRGIHVKIHVKPLMTFFSDKMNLDDLISI